jgi:dihydrofolate reductase
VTIITHEMHTILQRPMTKVQYYCAASLDGFIADPGDGLEWLTGYQGSYSGPEAEPGPMSGGGSYDEFYEGVGALVSGSATYEWVLDHTGDGSWPYRDKPWWVLSSRDLEVREGEGIDVRTVNGSVAELHDEIASSAGDRNLWVVGGGPVASQYADAALLDEVFLTVVPVVLGNGKPLFESALPSALQLTGTTVFDTGMVELRYEIRR